MLHALDVGMIRPVMPKKSPIFTAAVWLIIWIYELAFSVLEKPCIFSSAKARTGSGLPKDDPVSNTGPALLQNRITGKTSLFNSTLAGECAHERNRAHCPRLFRGYRPSTEKPSIGAARRVLTPEYLSHVAIYRVAVAPIDNCVRIVGQSRPRAVTPPIPVMTTRRLKSYRR